MLNYKDSENKNENQIEGKLLNQINEPFKSYIKNEIPNNNLSSFNHFSDIILSEEKYLLKEIELDRGIE